MNIIKDPGTAQEIESRRLEGQRPTIIPKNAADLDKRQAELDRQAAELREERDRQASIVAMWESHCVTHTRLKQRYAGAVEEIAGIESQLLVGHEQLIAALGEQGALTPALNVAQAIASVQSAIPILKEALTRLAQQVAESAARVRKFAKENSVPAEFIPEL